MAQRLAAPPSPLVDVLAASSRDDVRFRRVVAEGTFDPTHEVILYGRTQSGQTGNHVLTPLLLADGTAVAVDRGWVPLSDDDPPLADAAPPSGHVRVTGVLFPSEADGGDGTGDGDEEGPRTTFTRLDLPALGESAPLSPCPRLPAPRLAGARADRPPADRAAAGCGSEPTASQLRDPVVHVRDDRRRGVRDPRPAGAPTLAPPRESGPATVGTLGWAHDRPGDPRPPDAQTHHGGALDRRRLPEFRASTGAGSCHYSDSSCCPPPP